MKTFKERNLLGSFVFYPWAVSGFAIGLIWAWMFNGQFGIINDILVRVAGLLSNPIGFLSDPKFAMMSVIIANVWYKFLTSQSCCLPHSSPFRIGCMRLRE